MAEFKDINGDYIKMFRESLIDPILEVVASNLRKDGVKIVDPPKLISDERCIEILSKTVEVAPIH